MYYPVPRGTPAPPVFQQPSASHHARPGRRDLSEDKLLDVLLESLVDQVYDSTIAKVNAHDANIRANANGNASAGANATGTANTNAYANGKANDSANGNDNANAGASADVNADGTDNANAIANVIANTKAKAIADFSAVVVDDEVGEKGMPNTGTTAHVGEVVGGPPESDVADVSVDLNASVVSGDVAPQAEATVDQPTLAGVQEEVRALIGMVYACQAQVGSLGASLGLLTAKSTDVNGMVVDGAERQKDKEVTDFSGRVGEARGHTPHPREAPRTRARVDGGSDLEATVVEAGAEAGATAGRLEGAKSGAAVGAEAGAAAATAVLAKVEAAERRAVTAEVRIGVAEARAAAAEEAVVKVTAEATAKATAAAAVATAEATSAATEAAGAEHMAMRRSADDAHKAEKRSLGCHMMAGIVRRRCDRDKFATLMVLRCATSAAGVGGGTAAAAVREAGVAMVAVTEEADRRVEDANRARVEAEERATTAERMTAVLGQNLMKIVDLRVAEAESFFNQKLIKMKAGVIAAKRLAISRLPDRRADAAEDGDNDDCGRGGQEDEGEEGEGRGEWGGETDEESRAESAPSAVSADAVEVTSTQSEVRKVGSLYGRDG